MKRGFTLFEVIAVFVLLGITGAFAGMMLSSTVKQFSLERDAAAMNQKVEVAMARIVKELTWARPDSVVVSDGDRTLRWESRHPTRSGEEQELTWNGVSGGDLLLGPIDASPQPLLNEVESFAAISSAGYLQIQIRSGVQPTLHQTRIYLRDDI